MAGQLFLPGEQKVRPGVYVQTTRAGMPPVPGAGTDTVAVLFRASWGPLGLGEILETPDAIPLLYGTTGTVDALEEPFYGGARRLLPFRLGSSGLAASVILKDGSGEDAVEIRAAEVGTRGNGFFITLRDSLVDPALGELIVYEGYTVRQVIRFQRGQSEPGALVAAIEATNALSPVRWITATKLSDGDGTLANVTQVPLAGGVDPTVTASDYVAALSAIETADWAVLVADSEDPATHTAIRAYVDRVRAEGKRSLAVVGEPTTVPFQTRCQNAAALNHAAVVYVGNGFQGSDGRIREGYRAAARVAGMIAGSPVTSSLTHAPVAGAVAVVGELTGPQVEEAIRSGMLVFTRSATGTVQVEYGITTLVQPSADQDEGWRKIRRVRTRDSLISRIVAATDPLVGRLNNDRDGRATLVAVMQGVVNQMVAEGALLGGVVEEDKAHPPVGDSAWFRVAVDDLDSAERLYITFPFRFSP